MSITSSRARRTVLRLLAAAAVAGTLAACDTSSTLVGPESGVETLKAPTLHDAAPGDTTGRSGWTDPHG